MSLSFLACVLQPFILILLGKVLLRIPMFPRPLWDGIEKLVYYVLFPPLLFSSVASARLAFCGTGTFLACGFAAMACGVALSWIFSKACPAGPATDASVRQCGYRFNSYIGFALALSLYGSEGMALFALLVGTWVPISNTIAVADLTQAACRGRVRFSGIVRNVLKNPLILSTLLGLAFNLSGLQLPSLIAAVFKSLGNASLALALMAIGAGLQLSRMSECRMLFALASFERLVAIPAIALALGWAAGLPPLQLGALACFTVLPTGNSCYIMAVRLGGNGPAVANLTTVETVLSLATIPLWMSLLQ